MRKEWTGKDTWKAVLWVTAMLIVIIFTTIWYKAVSFNTEEESVNPNGTDSLVYVEGQDVTNSNDFWETVIQQSENPEDVIPYTGVTCSANIVNKNSFNIKDWVLTYNIKNECYLSGFWCGSVTVYQQRDGQIIENIIENQLVDVSSLPDLDRNVYTDNMMIHLLPGDRLVYLPSVKEHEDVIESENAVGIGFIFYYKDSLDLSDWELSYSNDMKLADQMSFKILIVLICVWIGVLILVLSLSNLEKRMKEQMNSRIKNISIMMDLYIEAYMVDISKNTAQLIKGDETKALLCLDGNDAQETINDRIAKNCQEDYREGLTDFLNLTDVAKRLENTSSMSFEFLAENQNWYAVRIISVDESAKQIVLTIQDISEEKKNLRQIEERVQMAEYKQNVSGSFLGTVSFALNDISAKVGLDAKTIITQTTEEETRSLADRISMNVRHMNLIQKTMLDLYEIERKKLILNIHEYDIYEMVAEIKHILEPFSVGKPYDFTVDVDKNISAKLYGDSDRIEQIIVILLFSSLLVTEKGFVKFSVYGKNHEDEEELIFSIRDSAKGFTETQLREIHDFINGESIETFDNASLVYHRIINGILKAMGSELKIVSVLNEGSDFYFTIRQKIVNNAESEE